MFTSTQHERSANFDHHRRALDNEELFDKAPSIFAASAHESRSDRFTAIPTIEIIEALRKEGFFPVAAMQGRSADDRAGHAKHVIRLRKFDGKKRQVHGCVNEIILKNANDGSTTYRIMPGVYRIVCDNSLIAQSSELDEVIVRHSANVAHEAIEGTYKVLKEFDKITETIEKWSGFILTKAEKDKFAKAAHLLRFTGPDGTVKTPIKPSQLLKPRRFEDQKDDLWTIFNVVQENCIKGGTSNVNSRGRKVTTKGVANIEGNINLNKALWALAEKTSNRFH